MKDGKYEVGDVIAFRVVRIGAPRTGEMFLNYSDIDTPKTMGDNAVICFARSDFASTSPRILERIPNPKLMEGEWWKGWTWKKVSVPNYKLQPGEVQLYYSGTLVETGRLECERPTLGASGTCGNPQIVLIPPPPDPKPLCPELREKIERVEAELALLKKQALGE